MGPAQVGVRRHVGEERDVAVREGGGREARVEGGDAGAGVGPGVQVVPGQGEGVDLGRGPEVGDLPFVEEGAEGGVVVLVDADEGAGWVVRGGEMQIAGAPLLGEAALLV